MEEWAREPSRGVLDALLRRFEEEIVAAFVEVFLEEDSSKRRRNWELFMVRQNNSRLCNGAL